MESEDAKGSRGEGNRRVRQEEMRPKKRTWCWWKERTLGGFRGKMRGMWQDTERK